MAESVLLVSREVLYLPFLPTRTGASTAEGLHVLPLNGMTAVGLWRDFCDTMAMNISADQGHV